MCFVAICRHRTPMVIFKLPVLWWSQKNNHHTPVGIFKLPVLAWAQKNVITHQAYYRYLDYMETKSDRLEQEEKVNIGGESLKKV